METFEIEIQEFLSKVIEIQADNSADAILKAREMYRKEEIVLDWKDHLKTEIKEYTNE
ncbi:MAG: DpnD/PcfM family protein [Flavobacteriia bacterium]|nr:DpnD/PcfM family protein [Flavobacteriia bacterium]